jgi:hypothetical protein
MIDDSNPTKIDPEIGNIDRKALIDFFRQIILTDWDYEDVKDADDNKVLTDFTGPHTLPDSTGGYIDHEFLKSKVFGEVICSKIKKYKIELDNEHWWENPVRRMKNDGKSLELFSRYVHFFNPDIVYRYFAPYEDGDHNLFVLERQSLNETERRQLIQRGENWLNVTYDIHAEMETYHGWGWYLSKILEYMIAKADPDANRDFIHSSKVMGFFRDGIVSNSAEGMKVENFDQSKSNKYPFILLKDGFKPKRFNHLIGQEVRYHFVDYFSYTDKDCYGRVLPYGKLVSI